MSATAMRQPLEPVPQRLAHEELRDQREDLVGVGGAAKFRDDLVIDEVYPQHGRDAQAEQGARPLRLVLEAEHNGHGERRGVDDREAEVTQEHALGERVPLEGDHLGVGVVGDVSKDYYL